MPSVRIRLSLLAASIAVVGFGLTGGAPIAAHDGIASSDPVSGSVLDEPIDSVTIDFGAEIGSTTQIAVLAPDGSQIPSATMVTSASTATSEFETIEAEGTYTVNYLATSVVDGHVLGGAISFTYGDTTADTMSPVLFGAIAVVILGIGGWFSWRARQRSHATAAADPADRVDAP
ncbi:MAG: copper resistance protein CopC [Ilumatobacteraceae bacterium]